MRDGNEESSVSSDLSKAGFLSNLSSVVEVEIFISKTPKLASNESLELEIAFTPYICKYGLITDFWLSI